MRVLVLGGGYAGLLVAKQLERRLPDDVELTVVDDTGTHLVQHELHRVIRRAAYADEITIPLTELLHRAEVVEASVTELDRAARTVSLDEGDDLIYDACAICLGAETDFHGIPGLEAAATPLKRIEHAEAIRREFVALVGEGGGTVVVGGAGLSGVQAAGELAAAADEAGAAGDVRVVLLEQEGTVAPGFPEQFREAVRTQLGRAGVEVYTGTEVEGVDGSVLGLDGQGPPRLPADQLVWTGGIRGPDATGGERFRVRGDLRVDDRTVAVGDVADAVDGNGERVPPSAQAAVRAAGTAARNILAVVERDRSPAGEAAFAPVEQWTFESPGWLVSVGDDAVAQLGPQVVTGPLANLVKSTVGVTYLAEHGSLRRALGIVREEMDESTDLKDLLRDRL